MDEVLALLLLATLEEPRVQLYDEFFLVIITIDLHEGVARLFYFWFDVDGPVAIIKVCLVSVEFFERPLPPFLLVHIDLTAA